MSALLRLISILCSLVLLASFAMFATDQAGKGEKQTVAQIDAGDGTSSLPQKTDEPEKKHGSVRNAIDKVNDKLVAPFDGILASDSAWAQHIVQTLLAFLVFGLGLGFLARYASTRGV